MTDLPTVTALKTSAEVGAAVEKRDGDPENHRQLEEGQKHVPKGGVAQDRLARRVERHFNGRIPQQPLQLLSVRVRDENAWNGDIQSGVCISHIQQLISTTPRSRCVHDNGSNRSGILDLQVIEKT